LPFLFLKKQPAKSNTLDKALLYFTVAVNERPGCCNFSFDGHKDTSLLHWFMSWLLLWFQARLVHCFQLRLVHWFRSKLLHSFVSIHKYCLTSRNTGIQHLIFSYFRFAQILVFCVVFCKSLFAFFLSVIILSVVLRFYAFWYFQTLLTNVSMSDFCIQDSNTYIVYCNKT
jgi:hypothetical protein